jgi:hypothetical protein
MELGDEKVYPDDSVLKGILGRSSGHIKNCWNCSAALT